MPAIGTRVPVQCGTACHALRPAATGCEAHGAAGIPRPTHYNDSTR
ncbi:hypothetical protein PTE31013_04551 [Pandoraea terrigena]|uniref:Uncharacterized protein n=1 Tax=Pandoraea terrigena TaxID=2508292 RepID=A0A5E4YH19_9BURK|nr:hypothetical protein PTE31013_04551 [Pandoraea terrigena]